MTTALSIEQLLNDETLGPDFTAEPTVTTLDATTRDWPIFQVRVPVCARFPHVRFSTSPSFGRTFAHGILATCYQDASGTVVTLLGSSARADRLSEQVAQHRPDVPMWLDAEIEVVFDEADEPSPAPTWIQMASDLFAGSRNMTSAERGEFDAIVQQRQRPLKRLPRKLPPTAP